MKRLLVFSLFSVISIALSAQGFEFRVRGGANFQRSENSGSEFSLYPHMGAMAGLRISTIGIYSELLYSSHEEANGLGAIAYIVPSVLARYYTSRMIYIELGIPYYILAEDVDPGFSSNPDKEAGFYGGMGVTIKRFEAGLRSAMSPFKVVHITASIKF